MNQRLANVYRLLEGKKCGITNGFVFHDENWTGLDVYRLEGISFVISSHYLMVGRLLAHAHVVLFQERECAPGLDRGLIRYMQRNGFECGQAAEEESSREAEENDENANPYDSLFE